jgi:hypothetical protein
MGYIISDRTRSALNIAIWVLVSLELVLSLVVIGITAARARRFTNDLGCNSPNKLNYNIAAVSTNLEPHILSS